MLCALALTVAGAGVVAINSTPQRPVGSSGAIPSGPSSTAAVVAPPARPGTTFRDFVFETEIVTAPTATKAQSKLWYAADTWWAGMYQPVSSQLRIFKLDWATQRWADTGTLVDERPQADPDFLWDGEHLYVVSAGHTESVRHAGRVLRFTLDEKGERFTLDHNFPVTVTPSGTSAAVIAIDTTGVLWVAYQEGGRIWTVHSLDHAAHWTDPAMLPGQCVIALGEQIPRCFVTSSGIPIQVSLTESRMHSTLASAATSTRPPAGRELDGIGEKVSQDLSDRPFISQASGWVVSQSGPVQRGGKHDSNPPLGILFVPTGSRMEA